MLRFAVSSWSTYAGCAGPHLGARLVPDGGLDLRRQVLAVARDGLPVIGDLAVRHRGVLGEEVAQNEL